MKLRKLKVNKDLGNYKPGTVVTIKCDQNGTPLERFWRRRIADSVRDNCVEFVELKKQSKGDK